MEKEHISIQKKYIESKRSLIYRDKNNFYKLFKTRRFIKSNYRILIGRSKACLEANGNHILKSLGLSVPKLKFCGACLFSRQYNEILVFENLGGFISVGSAIKNHSDDFNKKELLYTVAQQFNTLTNNGIYFRDFHFDNVMVDTQGNLCWVDTTIKNVRNKSVMQSKIYKRLQYLQLDKENWLSESDWNFFKQHINMISR